MTRRRSVLILVFVLALALFAAGCSGGRSPAAPAVASTTGTATASATAQNEAVAFARCLRTHGLSNWPDPTTGGVFDKAKLRQLGYSVSRVRAVEDGACKHLVPTGPGQQETASQSRTRRADALSFATCMRNHGVARFPDPTADGNLTVEMVKAQGIDVRSPTILRVVQSCLPASHGALTPAKVREALHEAGG
jgi:hypothetical protein